MAITSEVQFPRWHSENVIGLRTKRIKSGIDVLEPIKNRLTRQCYPELPFHCGSGYIQWLLYPKEDRFMRHQILAAHHFITLSQGQGGRLFTRFESELVNRFHSCAPLDTAEYNSIMEQRKLR